MKKVSRLFGRCISLNMVTSRLRSDLIRSLLLLPLVCSAAIIDRSVESNGFVGKAATILIYCHVTQSTGMKADISSPVQADLKRLPTPALSSC
jgi:hypothetical protein